jgi:hypothetical protein
LCPAVSHDLAGDGIKKADPVSNAFLIGDFLLASFRTPHRKEFPAQMQPRKVSGR